MSAPQVEILEKLERKMTLTLPLEVIRNEVDTRLKKIARTARMDGFRPGKVPLSIVIQRYGYSVQYEVVNDKVGEAFFNAANEAKLRVAGQPTITEKSDAPEGQISFDVVFEVLPEVQIGDLSGVEIETVATDITDEAMERTLEVLRKQRRSFAQRAQDAAAQEGDRVTVDFSGKIDGVPFEGGKAEGFAFVVGEGQMLKEFEEPVRGMKVGQSKTFPLVFPADYHGKEVAGKTADFMVTVKKIEAQHLPEVDDQLAKSLGVADGTVAALREDIRKNLAREIKLRTGTRNSQAVLDALVKLVQVDLPKSSVQAEINNMVANARADLKARGIKDADTAQIPEDVFRPQAEQRVHLGLVVGELVRAQNLQPTPEQIRARVEEIASSYEKPDEVVRYYYDDQRRIDGVQAMVLDSNVTTYVLSKAKVTEKKINFDELMGRA
ncbi:MAG: trigger factor [Burkholderiaceae bacterium]|jgi:trigger factor|nr:trigger factor [Burkholderiaceae bacterium]